MEDCRSYLLGPKEFPKFSTCTTILLAIACIFPGLGLLIISSCCCEDKDKYKCKRALAGCTQFLSSYLIIGWLASLYTGFLLIHNKCTESDSEINQEDEKEELNKPKSEMKETEAVNLKENDKKV